MLSNILLTPFDKEMRRHGYQLTRWADDWVVTCRTRAEAQNVLARAEKILEELGVTLNREKTRIVHIAQGFEFLGFKIQRGKGQFKLAHDRIKSKLNRQNLYAIPTQKSVDRFKDQIRALTKYAGWKKYPTPRLRAEFTRDRVWKNLLQIPKWSAAGVDGQTVEAAMDG
jgi:RNA-directed DNA polymerase